MRVCAATIYRIGAHLSAIYAVTAARSDSE